MEILLPKDLDIQNININTPILSINNPNWRWLGTHNYKQFQEISSSLQRQPFSIHLSKSFCDCEDFTLYKIELIYIDNHLGLYLTDYIKHWLIEDLPTIMIFYNVIPLSEKLGARLVKLSPHDIDHQKYFCDHIRYAGSIGFPLSEPNYMFFDIHYQPVCEITDIVTRMDLLYREDIISNEYIKDYGYFLCVNGNPWNMCYYLNCLKINTAHQKLINTKANYMNDYCETYIKDREYTAITSQNKQDIDDILVKISSVIALGNIVTSNKSRLWQDDLPNINKPAHVIHVKIDGKETVEDIFKKK